MEQDRVAAGIVLYNSDFDRFLLCLDSLNNQVETIFIIDNSPNELSVDRQELFRNYSVQYYFVNENLGMPEAMNRIMEMADAQGYNWVLTMNADSIIPNNMVEEYRKFFVETNIGMICPQVIDKRRKYMKPDINKKNCDVNMCITSAACTRIQAWKQVGGFDGWLFVDLLDNDISKRMILNGWRIFQINSIILDQEFGDIQPKSKNEEAFWVAVGKVLKNNNFAKFSYKKIVHPNRVYYTCRNIVYLNKKFADYGGIGYEENYNCKTFGGFIICFILPSILRSDKKTEVVKAVISGFKDGRKKEVAKWQKK